MSASSRRKGNRYEREVALVLTSHGLPCDRTARQGGLVVSGDLTGVAGYHFECKRQERLQIPEWLKQARADAGYNEVPVVVFRRSNEESHAILPLAALAELLALAKLRA